MKNEIKDVAPATNIPWRKGCCGWIRSDGKHTIRIRGPIAALGNSVTGLEYWLYLNHHRYTPTGRYEDAVHFSTLAAAKKFANTIPTC